jgi:CheY-like chemotaxis protein
MGRSLRLRLLHWNAIEAEERAGRLRVLGHAVDAALPPFPALLRELSAMPPDLLLLDLGRLPSQGRDAAMALRHRAATRRIPILLVGGEAAKVAAVRKHLPDVAASTWDDVEAGIQEALSRAGEAPVVPASAMAAYAGAPLLRKLGIVKGSRVALLGSAPGLVEALGPLPRGASLTRQPRARADLTLWAPASAADLERRVRSMKPRSAGGALWVVWPKAASGAGRGLTQPLVRRAGLAAGMVDYKVARIDATWTGLRFTLRATPSRRG